MGAGLGGLAAHGRHPEWALTPYRTIEDLWKDLHAADVIFIDIPIGLRDGGKEERSCDLHARRLLGVPRASSVFPAPCRPALYASDYIEASTINRTMTGRGLSRQSWAIVRKIREVDSLLRNDKRARGVFREVHPELLFWALNGGKAMGFRKGTRAGFEERLSVLENCLPESKNIVDHAKGAFRRADVRPDDVLDALVAALTAFLSRCFSASIPEDPDRDEYGLPMEMVFYAGVQKGKYEGYSK